ncbi:Putative tyrosine-protein kinase YveL [Fundidesulfovibrio magnetotacticus]|uniref:non-specific protein-tyrosine kinase n=1 Tax=Fundidesulfovibrio magnetotacticus TaxID=2730080 RepID=A0A6V8LMJ3_9BACT|nr:XrtA-associated tyrosine autokinase [Fundidesulfovibrio magnetotacticus]GFK93892.1 Putative tyrosine-protein kinase YveL [Fundidesulfovibrio magnetotacticus]
MSRIEEALNKAALRHPGQVAAVAPTPPPPNPAGEAVEIRPVEHMLFTYTSPNSLIAEEYRKLKECIIRESKREGFNNVLLVTSVNPREGKSVTTLNLAISLAQEYDYTVLVVDADLRAPSCHKYLGIEATVGLTDCLEGRAECSDVLIRSSVGRLVLLPAGRRAENPVELLSSNRMRQLLQELKHRYPDRFILIDSPPAKLFAETRFLAGIADSTLLVVREGGTSLQDVEETVLALDQRVMGIVYNGAKDLPFRDMSQHYYYYAQSDEAAR